MSKDTKSVMDAAITAVITQPINPEFALENDKINYELFNIKAGLNEIEGRITELKQSLEDVWWLIIVNVIKKKKQISKA